MYGSEEIFADNEIIETEASETVSEIETVTTQVPDESYYDLNAESETDVSDETVDVYESIISNQETMIIQLQEQNSQIAETNTVLVNFFFCFMVLMVCKFVHFLFYKVFFGGIT